MVKITMSMESVYPNFTVFLYFLVIGRHKVFDLQMTLKRKNNHSTEFSVFKLVEYEILQDPRAFLSKVKNSSCLRWQPSWFFPQDDLEW